MFDLPSSTSSDADLGVDALVVVVHRDREDLLGALLADHVVVEDGLDLGRLGDRRQAEALRLLLDLLGDDVVAEADALVADVDRGPGDELLDLLLALPAERAGEVPVIVALTLGRHYKKGSIGAPPAAQPTAGLTVYFTWRGLLLDEHVVDEAVLLGLVGAHEVVALGVGLDALDRLPGVLDQELVQLVARPQDLLGVDVDVGRLAREAAQRLVDHDARVRQRVALALGAGREQERAHRGRLPHADGRHVGAHVLHGVVDRHARPSPTRPGELM